LEFSDTGGYRGLFLYRTPLFDRCLDNLRAKGGTASVAARRVDEFMQLIRQDGDRVREKFSFTWNGEYRIKHCRKIDISCGYRIVCIKRDCHLILLYVGSHDDCFRWIERNKGLRYDINPETIGVRLECEKRYQDDALPADVLEETEFVREYEESFMRQLDDEMLLRIFPGWQKR
jgi:hypothetical protein